MCPICMAKLGNPRMSQAEAKLLFQSHAGGSHFRTWSAQNGTSCSSGAPFGQKPTVREQMTVTVAPPPKTRPAKVATPSYGSLTWCTESGCKWTGAFPDLEQHIKTTHSGPKLKDLKVDSFPFELLPPGDFTIGHVINHYRRISRTALAVRNREIDYSRLEAIRTLQPTCCHVGKDSWLGYVVFEFPNLTGVALECPIKNNATYVIDNGWKSMISISKAELRSECINHYKRVIHTSLWLNRIKAALRSFR